MKIKLKLTLILVFSAFIGQAQCYPDRHNTTWFDSWLSCETSENPNPAREASHWIAYNLNETKALGTLKMWNINAPEILDYGAKEIIIDYSVDGKEWIEYGRIQLNQASGKSTYEGEEILDFNNLEARHLLFTISENYGGECAGFSEIKIAVKPTENDENAQCLIAEVYPNPVQAELSVYLAEKCLNDVYLAIEDATGRTVISESLIKLYETKLINVQGLEAGVYFVCLRTGDNIKQRYKIVKE